MNSNAHTPSASSCERGFTAIELITVLTITAILATVVVPSFKSVIAAQRVRAATSRIQDSLWFSRSEALKRNTTIGFTLTTLGAGWKVTDTNGNVYRNQDGMSGLSMKLSTGSSMTFQYNSYGRLTNVTSAMTIQLSSPDGSNKQCISFDAAAKAHTTAGACP